MKQSVRTAMRPRRKVVVLTMTHACNLRCSYCYETDKETVKLSTRRMSVQTAKNIIAAEFTSSSQLDELEFDFHGGEPLLEFPAIREVCDWTWAQRWGKPYLFFITTNGTALTDEMRAWLFEHKHQLWC